MRVLVTGSTQGLGRLAAEALLDDGHQVVVHARNEPRRATLDDLVDRGATVVVGDLADVDQVRDVADQVGRLGRTEAVIHNAGVASGPALLPVNVVAPYLLTSLLPPPDRLVFLSSSMHRGGRADLAGLDWSGRQATASYSDSKLLLTALALGIARLWPRVCSNAVDPGWVPTRMGGANAPDDLQQGAATQVWLATSGDPGATTSGGYWRHRRRADPHPAALDPCVQDALLDALAEHTQVRSTNRGPRRNEASGKRHH